MQLESFEPDWKAVEQVRCMLDRYFDEDRVELIEHMSFQLSSDSGMTNPIPDSPYWLSPREGFVLTATLDWSQCAGSRHR